jgi:hypothetical protein
MAKFAATILLIFISFSLQAQTWEIGLGGGGSGYMGDLNPNNPLKISGFAANIFVKRNFNPYFSARLSYTLGMIQGADSTSSSAQFRQRNLSFKTPLSEFSLIGEFNFMNYLAGISNNRYTPFLFLGVSTVAYNPQAVYKGHTYNLRPLRTEDEAKQYPGSAIAIPYGVGIKYNFTGSWNLIADLGYRQPSTDYLDDVAGYYPNPSKLPSNLSRELSDRSGEKTGIYTGTSDTQRGDLRTHDTYLFLQVSVSYTFLTSKCYFDR